MPRRRPRAADRAERPGARSRPGGRGGGMELGIVVPNAGRLATAEALYRIAEHAEALGFAAVWTADHLVLPVATGASYPYTRAKGVSLDPDWPFLEPLVALAGIAARTRRIGLGVSVYL